MRDYREWHRAYDDPDSDLSWRLGRVQDYVRTALDESSGPVTVLSVCAGDGRDVLGVLAARPDADRVTVDLLEIDEVLAEQGRQAAETAGLTRAQFHPVDAGSSDAYEGLLPADLVLLVGVFGNISDVDLERLVDTAPQLCASGATLVWSRGRDTSDRNDLVRAWFAEAGFVELSYLEHHSETGPALGAMRFVGSTPPLVPHRHLFTFLR